MSSKEVRLTANVWVNKYFAISVGAIMVLLVAYHWGNVAYLRYGPRKPISPLRMVIRYRR